MVNPRIKFMIGFAWRFVLLMSIYALVNRVGFFFKGNMSYGFPFTYAEVHAFTPHDGSDSFSIHPDGSKTYYARYYSDFSQWNWSAVAANALILGTLAASLAYFWTAHHSRKVIVAPTARSTDIVADLTQDLR